MMKSSNISNSHKQSWYKILLWISVILVEGQESHFNSFAWAVFKGIIQHPWDLWGSSPRGKCCPELVQTNAKAVCVYVLMCTVSVCDVSDQRRSPASAGSLPYRSSVSSVPYIIPAVSNNAVTVYCSPDGCLIPSAQPQVPVSRTLSLSLPYHVLIESFYDYFVIQKQTRVIWSEKAEVGRMLVREGIED